jgi:hypothetical protein
MSDKIPLPGTFMLLGLLGFLISAYWTFSGRFNLWFAWAGQDAGNSFGFGFMVVFLVMFIASVASMTPSFDELDKR